MPVWTFAALFADLTGERQASEVCAAPAANRCHKMKPSDERPRRRSCGNTNQHLSVAAFPPGLQLDKYLRKDRRLRIDKTPQIKRIGSGQVGLGPVSLGESKDVGGFLAEVPLPPEASRHRHNIGCRGADHVDLAVVQKQVGTATGRHDNDVPPRISAALDWRAAGDDGGARSPVGPDCASTLIRPTKLCVVRQTATSR
jgi:hypothetical protein